MDFGSDTDTEDKDEDEDAVIDAIHNDHSREILVRVSEEPMSVSELTNEIDASKPTIYRRIEELEDLELVVAHTRTDSDGHHRDVYVTALEEVRVRIESGEYSVSVDRRPVDAVDRFTQLMEDLS